MPDATSAPPLPRDWSAAFAALPQETPGEDGWARIEARLPAASMPRARGRQRTSNVRRAAPWFALAAVLALAAVVPWRWMQDASPSRESVDASRVTSAAPAVRPPDVATGEAATQPDAADASSQSAIAATPVGEAVPSSTEHRATRHDTQPRVAASVERRAAHTRVASATRDDAVPRAALATVATANEPIAAQADHDRLDALYAESARLEALLTLARDDRVASGTAAALAGAFDAQVAGIDAALIQPGLSDDARTSLWRARVDALRQAAGFESTRRVLAAQGERYDATLVSID